jgi:hypothetical protein
VTCGDPGHFDYEERAVRQMDQVVGALAALVVLECGCGMELRALDVEDLIAFEEQYN